MVEDYALRKLAKKKRKREGADERGKRVRTKKNKVRRICRGQCYKEPFAVRRPGQTVGDVEQEITAQDDDVEAAQTRQPKAKRRRKASSQESVQQSTSINLHSRRSHVDNAAPAVTPTPESFASLPLGIQQFMRDQRLTGLTPIQERLATVLSHEQLHCLPDQSFSLSLLFHCRYAVPCIHCLPYRVWTADLC